MRNPTAPDERQYRYMIALGDKSVCVTAASQLDAIKAAAEQFQVDWKSAVADMIVTPLREIRPKTLGF